MIFFMCSLADLWFDIFAKNITSTKGSISKYGSWRSLQATYSFTRHMKSIKYAFALILLKR